MFAQKMIMQHPDTKEVIAKCGKANGLVRIEPAEKMPVFCMFAVYEDDCKVDITGASIINLSDDKKQTIREHFPNADAVAVIPNPEEFIEDVKRSIGTEIKAEKVNYFHIDKGYETTDGEIAMDMEYMLSLIHILLLFVFILLMFVPGLRWGNVIDHFLNDHLLNVDIKACLLYTSIRSRGDKNDR